MSAITEFVNRDPALKKRFKQVGSQMTGPRRGAGRRADVPVAEQGREASPPPPIKRPMRPKRPVSARPAAGLSGPVRGGRSG